MSRSRSLTVLSRRNFLRRSQAALALLGALPLVPLAGNTAAYAETPSADDDYYAKLGVDTIINAAGTYTYLTAALMPPQVQRAVARAALHPVVLKELQQASGAYLARKLHCEAALVTSGASAALTLATAACIMAANNCRPEQIPQEVWTSKDHPGMKSEVIVQKAHRYEYDHAMQLCGARIMEVVTLDDYRQAFSPNTVMTNFFNSAEAGEKRVAA